MRSTWRYGFETAGQDVTGVIQHSDAGAQYTALRYSERLTDVGAIASIGTVGDSTENEYYREINPQHQPALGEHALH